MTQPTEPAPEEQAPRLDPGERRAIAKIAVGLVLLVLFIIFVIQNARPVQVDFVFFSAQIRLIWVFLACALIGALVTWLVGRQRRR